MIRRMTLVALCLGVATLGFARPCPCDHEAAESGVSMPAGSDDCPHAANADVRDDLPTGDAEGCLHCVACAGVSALPVPPSAALAQALVRTDFDAPLPLPSLGTPSLPLRPPIV